MVELDIEQTHARVSLAARAWMRSGGDPLALAPYRDVTRKTLAEHLKVSAPKLAAWVFRLTEERVLHETVGDSRLTLADWKDERLAINMPAASWRALLPRFGSNTEAFARACELLAAAEPQCMSLQLREHQARAEIRARLGQQTERVQGYVPLHRLAREIVTETSGAAGLRLGLAAVHSAELLGLSALWPSHAPRAWAGQHLSLWLGTSPELKRPVRASLSASDDARLLRRIGEDYVHATHADGVAFAVLHDPDARKALAFGVCMSSLLAEPEFLTRTKGMSRGAATDAMRGVLRGAVTAAALADLSAHPDPRSARAALEEWSDGSGQHWRWLLAARTPSRRADNVRAVREGLALSYRLRELCDVDWWRNPRAATYVRAWVHEDSAEPAADGLETWLLEAERNLG